LEGLFSIFKGAQILFGRKNREVFGLVHLMLVGSVRNKYVINSQL
jgi:hypothetical protein